jgi:hypothetical protein
MRGNGAISTSTRRSRARLIPALAFAAIVAMLLPASAMAVTANDTTQFSVNPGTLVFSTAPDVPNLPALSLNGQAQTLNAQMNNFSVSDATGSGSGWNLTVNGDNSGGKSPVLAQYCPSASAPCGSDSAGYVASGATLPANSLTLNSSGASFTQQSGSGATPPTHSCNSGCFVDTAPASPTKIVSAASGAGMGTFQATNFSTTSVALAAPSTIKALPANEIYHVDLVWSLNTGP